MELVNTDVKVVKGMYHIWGVGRNFHQVSLSSISSRSREECLKNHFQINK